MPPIFKPFIVFLIVISNASGALGDPSNLPKFGDTPDRPISKEVKNWNDDSQVMFVLTKCTGLFLYLNNRIDRQLSELSEAPSPVEQQDTLRNMISELTKWKNRVENAYADYYILISNLGAKLGKQEDEIGYDAVSTAFGYERYNKSFNENVAGSFGPIIQTDGNFCTNALKVLANAS